MQNRARTIALSLTFALPLTVPFAGAARADSKGKTRAATTEQIMEGWVKPHTDAAKKAINETAKTEDTWKQIALYAALLNESSYNLVEDGRSVDKVWTAATKTLQKGSASLLDAAKTKNDAAAKTAFGATTKSCKECHDAHKKD